MTTLSEGVAGPQIGQQGSTLASASPLAERRDRAEQYLITASANITDALLVLLGTPFEEEIRSYLQDLYKVEQRVREQ